jgi:hypothetical protein
MGSLNYTPREILEANGFRLLRYTESSPHYDKSLYIAISPSNESLGAEGFEDEHLAFSVLLDHFLKYYQEKGRKIKGGVS